MSIITISRGSYSHGKEIAERLAQELDYTCVSREVLLAASKEFNAPEIALLRAIKNAPSFFQRFTHGKEKYISYIRAALLEYAMEDNMVYHGFAGHFLLDGMSNLLKVRISADPEDRARIVMQKEKVSRKRALKTIKDIDDEREKWAIHLYGKNPCDLNMYDLGIVISRLSVDNAIDNILFTVKLPAFQTTPQAQKIVKNLALAARVKSGLINFFPQANVSIEDDTVVVHIKRSLEQEEAVEERIRAIVMELPGVEAVRVDVLPIL